MNNPAVVIASGPTAIAEGPLRAAHSGRLGRAFCANDAYTLMEGRERKDSVLYAGDAAWWYRHEGAPRWRGERWVSWNGGPGTRLQAAARYGLNLLEVRHGHGLLIPEGGPEEPMAVHSGSCSGFALFNAAFALGYDPIWLIGHDCAEGRGGQLHFFGDHPPPLRNGLPFAAMRAAYGIAARQAQIMGREVKVVNPRGLLGLGFTEEYW